MFAKKPYRAVGMMSGTSLDGIDAAEVVTDGETIFDFGQTRYHVYDDQDRAVIAQALGKWPDPALAPVGELVDRFHVGIASVFRPDIFGYHGQTLAHDPGGRGTHQIGNGQVLADALGVPVAWDFRTRDVAMGGQGAPLAPFFHFACAKYIGATAPLAVLNLGGVGNITFVDPKFDRPEDAGAVMAFDTGPANAPINDLMQARFGCTFDQDGRMASRGQIDASIIERFLQSPFFQSPPPKSLDRDDFAMTQEWLADLSDQDAVATATYFVSASVARAMAYAPQNTSMVLVTGGGRKNPVILDQLRQVLNCRVYPIEHVGLDGDMLEAQAFAYLAVRVARGLPISAPMTTGVPAPATGGRVALPRNA